MTNTITAKPETIAAHLGRMHADGNPRKIGAALVTRTAPARWVVIAPAGIAGEYGDPVTVAAKVASIRERVTRKTAYRGRPVTIAVRGEAEADAVIIGWGPAILQCRTVAEGGGKGRFREISTHRIDGVYAR